MTDGENGLLVPPGDPEALAAAIRRILDEPGLRDRLAAAAKPSVEALSSDDRLRQARGAPVGGRRMTERPRVLFVGRARYSLPLPAWLAKKWDAVEQELDYRVIGAATEDSGPSDDRFRLARPARPRRLDGAPLLPPAAAAAAAPDSELPAAGDLRVRSLSRRGGARRPSARPPPGAGDRRGTRRLADVLAAVRLARTPADQPVRGRARGLRGPAGRRDAGRLELHGGPRRGDARGAAERSLHGVQRPLGVLRARACSASRTADGGSSSGRSRPTRTSKGSPPRGGSSPIGCPRPGS